MDAYTAKLLRSRSGMLFQHGALFSAMTVFDNIAQPLRELGKIPDALLRDIVALKLEMVGFPNLKNRLAGTCCKFRSRCPPT